MLNGEIPTEQGYAITDGFVLIHSPESLTEQRCKVKDLDTMGGVLLSRFLTAYGTPESGIYNITEPFPLTKVASTLRELCKQYQTTNRFKQSYITFTGTNKYTNPICATFNVRHLQNAFDCVGKKAVGILCKDPELFNGMAFLLVEGDNPHDLSDGIHAIVMQSRCLEGV